jgi:Protein kinase domain/Inner membrane component of T3SS, cytoplasmic domain
MAELVFLSGPEEGRTFVLESVETILGREDDCACVLDGSGISRHHGKIIVEGDVYRIMDLGSTNGVIVNGNPIDNCEIKDGDNIDIGGVRMQFCAEELANAAPKRTASVVAVKLDKPAGDALIGKVIGGAKVLGKIKDGRLGLSYKAVNEESGAPVVLKILPPQMADKDDVVKRFARQAKAGAALNHPNIVCTLGAGSEGSIRYIIMEYVEGRSLQGMLDEVGDGNPLDTALTLDILIGIAHALEHAHEQKIVHRDIKPGNIIVTADGSAKLDNLWLAKHVHGTTGEEVLTQEGKAAGTLAYMPPEQIDDALGADCRSDIYSLAATIYRCLTGKIPCPGKSVMEMVKSIQTSKPAPVKDINDNVPSSVSIALDKALEKDRMNRYQTPKEFAIDLKLARKYQVK